VVDLENILNYQLVTKELSSSLFLLVLVGLPNQQVPFLLIVVFILVEFITTLLDFVVLEAKITKTQLQQVFHIHVAFLPYYFLPL
jgi:hypothetical protein